MISINMQITVTLFCCLFSVLKVLSSPSRLGGQEQDWIYVNEGIPSKDSLIQEDLEKLLETAAPGFKNTVEDYPESEIHQRMKKKPELSNFCNVSHVFQSRCTHEKNKHETDSACSSTYLVCYFQEYRNIENKAKIIVNHGHCAQAIYMNICDDKDTDEIDFSNKNSDRGSCKKKVFSSAAFSCRQKYARRSLLTYNSMGSLELDDFEFPCGCLCIKESEK